MVGGTSPDLGVTRGLNAHSYPYQLCDISKLLNFSGLQWAIEKIQGDIKVGMNYKTFCRC